MTRLPLGPNRAERPLAVAVFGALLAKHPNLLTGLRESLVIAAVVALAAAVANLFLKPAPRP